MFGFTRAPKTKLVSVPAAQNNSLADRLERRRTETKDERYGFPQGTFDQLVTKIDMSGAIEAELKKVLPKLGAKVPEGLTQDLISRLVAERLRGMLNELSDKGQIDIDPNKFDPPRNFNDAAETILVLLGGRISLPGFMLDDVFGNRDRF